jgi:hypothetical protein
MPYRDAFISSLFYKLIITLVPLASAFFTDQTGAERTHDICQPFALPVDMNDTHDRKL